MGIGGAVRTPEQRGEASRRSSLLERGFGLAPGAAVARAGAGGRAWTARGYIT